MRSYFQSPKSMSTLLMISTYTFMYTVLKYMYAICHKATLKLKKTDSIIS